MIYFNCNYSVQRTSSFGLSKIIFLPCVLLPLYDHISDGVIDKIAKLLNLKNSHSTLTLLLDLT